MALRHLAMAEAILTHPTLWIFTLPIQSDTVAFSVSHFEVIYFIEAGSHVVHAALPLNLLRSLG